MSETISSGQTSSGQTFSGSGTVVTVSSGGYLMSSLIESGASAVVSSGGFGSALTATGSQTSIVVSSGGFVIADTLSAGAAETISQGAYASATLVGSGCIDLDQGLVLSATIASGGLQFVTLGGNDFDVSIAAGGVQVVTATGIAAVAAVRGLQLVGSGGTAISATIAGNGVQVASAGGLVADDLVANGAAVEVQSGGIAVSATVSGIELVGFGGMAVSTTILSRGLLLVSGGTATFVVASGNDAALVLVSQGLESGGTILAGAVEIISSGGTADRDVIGSSCVQFVVGGLVSGTVVQSAGVQVVSLGFDSATIVSSGGSQLISSGGVAVSSIVQAGGLQTVSSGAASSDTIIQGGHVVISSGGSASGAVSFIGSGGTLTLGAGGVVGATISGFLTSGAAPAGTGNLLNLSGFGVGAIASSTTAGILTVTSGGSSQSLNVAGAMAGETFTVTNDAAGGIDVAACFLEGTKVLTPSGEVAIETLSVGDVVMTLADGALAPQPIVWTGRRGMRGADHPVRIRAHAFGENLPHRDLLLTPEHCVFVEGGLVPVRMLVNGRSIIVDRGIGAYSVHHLELARHAILVTEGLTTESYLDTGNRRSFDGNVVALRPDFSSHSTARSWSNAAAPLSVDRAFVEPIWHRLATRAGALGYRQAQLSMLTNDPDLHLLLEDGTQLRASDVLGNRHLFELPAGTTTLRVASRAASPAETIGPFVDDRRRLGVLVGEMIVHLERSQVTLTTHRDQSGWHVAEPGFTARWTDGSAAVDLPATARHLELQLLAGGPYPAEAAQSSMVAWASALPMRQ